MIQIIGAGIAGASLAKDVFNVIGIAIGFLTYSIEPNLSRNLKLLGVVISSFVIFGLYGLYSFKIGGYLLGFGVAHILSLDFMDYKLPTDLKLGFLLFLISISVLFLGSIGRLPITYPILSFLGCFVPNYIGNGMG